MAFKLRNKTTNKTFVIAVNGGATWEFEPGIWRTVDFLADREWEALDRFLGEELVHSFSGKDKGKLEDNLTNFPADDDYDKKGPDAEHSSKGDKASGRTFEETWELTKATLKFGENDKVKVGKTVAIDVKDLKGFKLVNKERNGAEAAYEQGWKINKAWTSDEAKVRVNGKSFKVEGVAAGTGIKIFAEIEATGNDKGKVTAEGTIEVEA